MTTFLPCDTPIDETSPLSGTVKPFTRWFLLEEPPSSGEEWGSHAVDHALETDPLLRGLKAQVEGAQLLFIRQARQREREGQAVPRRLFVCDPARETLYAADLPTRAALAQVDASGAVPTLAGVPMQPVSDPLYIVCTNARRDCRCGEIGQPVYAALREQVGEAAWEATHITGHKFAATLYVFPQAVCYGRLLPAHVTALVAAQESGTLLLEHYRGRSAYTQPMQVAEHYLLTQANRSGLHDVQVLGSEAADGQVIVRARVAGEAAIHRLTLSVQDGRFAVAAHSKEADAQ